jgi:hypothetical protein
LRSSNIDASADAVEELEPVVARIRQRWPEVKILLRGLKRNGSKCEFVEGKYAAPFRRMPKSSNGVSQHRQDATFGVIDRRFGTQQVLPPG